MQLACLHFLYSLKKFCCQVTLCLIGSEFFVSERFGFRGHDGSPSI